MNKKIIIIAGVSAVLILSLFLVLKPKEESRANRSVEAQGGVLKVSNIGQSNIRIIPSRTNTITIDLNGPEKELDKIKFFKVGNNTEFSVPDDWSGVSGVIRVPEGLLVDIPHKNEAEESNSDFIRLGGGSPYQSITLDEDTISFNTPPQDQGGGSSSPSNPSGDPTPPSDNPDPRDPTEPNPVPPPVNPSPPVDPPVEPNPVPPPIVPIDPEPEPPVFEEDPVGYTPEQCTIQLKQEYRNECCQQTNEDTAVPECGYGGYWLFNYHTRLCFYHCFHPCNTGTQGERDTCCASENYYTSTPGCIGDWKFDNNVRSCQYECLSEEELEGYYNQENPLGYRDFVSEECSSHNNPNECCDYNLKNEISIGPRPGFPDCIGRWEFPVGTLGCNFRCSDYGEMMDILKQLEEQNNN